MNAIRSLAAGVVALTCAGCSSYTVRQPTSGASLPAGPVAFRIEWTGGQMKNFTATLDGADIASQFTIGSSNATATITLTAGSHTFATTADVYDPLSRKDVARSSTIPFSVRPPATPTPSISLTVTPSSVQALRSGSPSVTVAASFSGGASAPAQITATGPALTAAASGTITSAPVPLMLTVKADAPFGMSTVQIKGTAGTASATASVSLRVLRATGAFASPSFAVTTAGQTATSPNGGAITLLARTGMQEGLPSAYAAVFRRGTATIGNAIGYNHGATNQPNGAYGGAGFCAAAAAGFVIAGRGPGVITPASAQYAVFFLDFSTARLSQQLDVASFRSAYYFEPRVWFSPDCSIAIAAGAHPTGPANNLAQVIDVATGAALGSFEFTATTFTASVTTLANGSQQVTVTADGQARPPMPIP